MSQIVTLKPTAGFCVKTTVLQPASYSLASSSTVAGPNALEPEHSPVIIPIGRKVFINIAWDSNVPPPPEASEESIQRAMKGLDSGGDAWYVPVVVSEGREDKDKAGKPSIVFDCVFNTAVKSRQLRYPEFKDFLIELSMQRIEAQTPLLLSRTIATPNISAKGKLLPRKVNVPSPPSKSTEAKKPLIEEISSSEPQSSKKGILKKPPTPETPSKSLRWSWTQTDNTLQITVPVPHLTHDRIPDTTLDVEPRRLILHIPDQLDLDLNLTLPDSEIAATIPHESDRLLELKRQRVFNVQGAVAEWRVAEKQLVIGV